MDRTSDDFRSFVCFLNIKSNTEVLSEEQIHYVLSGISEVTTDLEQQSTLLRTIVENDFKNGAKDLSDLQISQISKKSAERLLQEKLDKESEKSASLSNALLDKEKKITDIQEKFEKVEIERQFLEKKNRDESAKSEEEINRLNNLLDTRNKELDNARQDGEKLLIKDFYRKRRSKLIVLGIIILIIAGHLIWYFVVDQGSSSYMGVFVRWVSSLDDTRLKCFTPLIGPIIGSILIPLSIRLYKIWQEEYVADNGQ